MNPNQVSLICKALSDPNRIRIIQLLTSGEKCGCDLLEQMQITQPTLSHHMKALEGCGLVCAVKKGKWNHYSLNCDKWSAFRDYVESIRIASKYEGGCCS